MTCTVTRGSFRTSLHAAGVAGLVQTYSRDDELAAAEFANEPTFCQTVAKFRRI